MRRLLLISIFFPFFSTFLYGHVWGQLSVENCTYWYVQNWNSDDPYRRLSGAKLYKCGSYRLYQDLDDSYKMHSTKDGWFTCATHQGGSVNFNINTGLFEVYNDKGKTLSTQCIRFHNGKLTPYKKGTKSTDLNIIKSEIKIAVAFRKKTVLSRKKIQVILNDYGFYNGRIDGLYGPNTKAAIESYAKSIGKEDHLKSEKLAKELLQSLIFTSEDQDTDESKTKKGLF